MVQIRRGIEAPIWVFGFVSHDKKGIVYQNPYRKNEWLFFREEEEIPIYKRPLMTLTSSGKPRPKSLRECLIIGMMCEREMCRVLRPLMEPLKVYTLPWSGAHTKGTDLIITKHEEEDFSDPMKAIRRAEFAITSVDLRHGSLECRTCIPEWYERCLKDKVRPIVAWVENRYEKDEKYWFLVLDEESIHAVYYREEIPIKYSTSVRRTEKYKLSIDKFTEYVRNVLKSRL
jgi:hypothetical protein